MLKLNLSKCPAAQDMVRIVMRDNSLSAEEALKFSVNQNIYNQIVEAGYASIALDLWGHADPEREWDKLDEPQMEIEFDEFSQSLIDNIAEKEEVDINTAVAYFLLFTMDALGYHI